MPFYRITIFLRDKEPSQGIRQYDNSNIDAVTNIARVKAKQHYGDSKVIDVEAAMLSSHCTAVRMHLEAQEKKRRYSKSFGLAREQTTNRKTSRAPGRQLGERGSKRFGPIFYLCRFPKE